MKLSFYLPILFWVSTFSISAQPAYMLFTDQLATVNDLDANANTLWLATETGVVQLDIATTTYTTHLANNDVFVRVKMVGNTVWAAGKTTGLYRFDGTAWTNYSTVNGLVSDSINDFDISVSGTVWVATANGISSFNLNGFTTHNPFQHRNITAIHCYGDTVFAGNAAFNEPIKKYNQSTWLNMPNLQNAGNRTVSLKTSASGQLHCTSFSGLFSLNGTTWQQVTSYSGTQLSRNGNALKARAINTVYNQVNGVWDTLLNPMQLDAYGYLTALTSTSDSSFWCAVVHKSNTTLAHYFIQKNLKSYDELNVNALRGGISAEGTFFRNSDAGTYPGLTSQNKNLVFCANTFLSGWQGNRSNRSTRDPNYSTDGIPQSVVGPVSTNRNSAAFFNRYNRVWRVSKAQILAHQQQHNQPGYIMPEAILAWPGNGQSQHGEAQFIAPFIDGNANGIYEPNLGEYPEILGDEALFAVYNYGQGFSPYGQPMLDLEFRTMLYAYDSVNTPLHNTLFVNQQIVVKTGSYDTLLIGLWNDLEIGNYLDDMISCDSSRSMIYGFNGDLVDEGPLGFGSAPPAAGLVSLSHPLSGAMAANWVSGYTPVADEVVFNLLQSRFADGTVMRRDTAPGIGYLPGSSNPRTRYQFSSWFSTGLPIADKRNTGSITLSNLQPGHKICLDYAYHFARVNPTNDLFASASALITQTDYVKTFYQNRAESCPGIFLAQPEFDTQNSFYAYPNPVSDRITIVLQNPKNINESASVSLFNAAGLVLL